jgi:HD-GYP domain-containing protein (c-di-GMP phosphodiesterase class II)
VRSSGRDEFADETSRAGNLNGRTAPVPGVILQHHERLKGSGYPQGLKGADLLQEAKSLTVADVVEAGVKRVKI